MRATPRIALVCLALSLPAVSPGASIAVRASRLVDPEKGTATANVVIVVEDGVITSVGNEAPPGAELIDLGGRTVMPGLMDLHTHLCIGMGHPAGESVRDLYEALFLRTLVDSTGYRAIQGVVNARSMLEHGFTTVRDVGNSANYADTDLRRAIEERLVEGPTIVNAGRIIAAFGGQFPNEPPRFFRELFGVGHEHIGVLHGERPGLGEPEYLYADTRDEMRKAVRENVAYGARVIKIVMDDQPYAYDADDVRTIVAEAARAGRRVCAHSLTDAGARAAAEGGVASIEHGFLLSDETIQLMKRKGVTLVGTDFPRVALKAVGLPESMYDKVQDRLKRAHKAGLTLAFGTDLFFNPQGYSRGSMSAAYVDVYKEAGLPPADVLRMMTTNAARALGIEAERGALGPGMKADLIALDGDPLQDLDALKRVVFVMKDGRVVKR